MEIIDRKHSVDGKTVKYLQKGADEFVIETTYVDYDNKHIICFSSQVGCAVGCAFCASGARSMKARYVRSLTAKELICQCENIITDRGLLSASKPILFSCMGEGEPFLNFSNVVASLRFLGGRYRRGKLALSTSGVRPDLICRLARLRFSVPLKLQISLHSSNDRIRKRIIPVGPPLAEIVAAARVYREVSGRELEWNYVLMNGVNDSPECAVELARLLGPEWHVKLNQLNPITDGSFRPSGEKQRDIFKRILESANITTEFYQTDGLDVSAACGQLSYSVVDS